MTATGLVHHPLCLEHFAGPFHPERPERLTAILDRLRSSGLTSELELVEASAAPLDAIARVHSSALIREIERAASSGRAQLDDGDTYVSDDSYAAALRAAGGGIDAAERVLSGEWKNAFVAVRPPGHHAEETHAMGFCLFNNVAIVAKHLRARGVERVAVVDWDVHHGNGTQHLFERDPSVFYASLHQFPHYPGTGARRERGIGAGEGATLNCPMPAGSGDREWLAAFESDVLRALEDFRPQFVLVSAGFDAHRDDPLSGTRVTEEGFRAMSRGLLALAERHAQGRVVSLLEGGYQLESLASSALAHVEELRASSR
jgi:acetoin utilization deacetylase AcuC-like enzyme